MVLLKKTREPLIPLIGPVVILFGVPIAGIFSAMNTIALSMSLDIRTVPLSVAALSALKMQSNA
jgi:hypothetical protein